MPVETGISPSSPELEGDSSLRRGNQQAERGSRRRRKFDLGELHMKALDRLGVLILKLYGFKVEEPETTTSAPQGKTPTAPSATEARPPSVEQK